MLATSSDLKIHSGTSGAEDRLAEVAEILAAGLSRLKARQSSALSADLGESSLDCAARQSGHPEDSAPESSG